MVLEQIGFEVQKHIVSLTRSFDNIRSVRRAFGAPKAQDESML